MSCNKEVICIDEVTCITKEAYDNMVSAYKTARKGGKGFFLNSYFQNSEVVSKIDTKDTFKKSQENVLRMPTLASKNQINMKTIDLEAIIENNQLDTDALAVELFPNNKYPKMALSRVLKGEALLDSNQVSKLAMMLNVDISTLYTGGWKAVSKKDLHIISNKEFRAELNTKTWESKVFVNDTLYHSTLLHVSGITLLEYIENINKIVEQYKNQKNESNRNQSNNSDK